MEEDVVVVVVEKEEEKVEVGASLSAMSLKGLGETTLGLVELEPLSLP